MNNITLLNDLASEINAAASAATGAFNDGFNHAIRAGNLLIEAKRQHKHGDWGAWMQTNLKFKPRTAQLYMQVAKNSDPLEQNRNTVADFSLRGAIKQISKPRQPERSPVENCGVEPERATPHRHLTIEQPAAPTESHILSRMYGPLTGAEWRGIAEACRCSPIRSERQYTDAFLKLAAHFDLPLPELGAAE